MPAKYLKNSKRAVEKISELQKFAENKGGKFLSIDYKDNKTRYLWECKFGHQWKASSSSIINNGSWCPKCAGNIELSLKDVQAVADARGGKLISTVYKGVDENYEFECSKGHIFKNRFSHVKAPRNQWCPRCNKGSKSEEIARTTFEQIFDLEFPKERPIWLRNNLGKQMELDGYCKELGIAFEYQGHQHFVKSHYKQNLEKRILDDQRKVKLCKENGVTLIVLTHEMDYFSFPKEIERQLNKARFKYDAKLFTKYIDIEKAFIREDRIDELRELLKPKSIKVLSKTYLGSNVKVKLSCENCGHIWEAKGNAFFNRRRVAGCDKCNRKKAGLRNKKNIDVLIEFAEKFGGQLLDTEYKGSLEDYKWKCRKGHVFNKRFANMKFRNSFCPFCDGKQIRKSVYVKD